MLLQNPVIQGLLGGGPNAIRAQADQQRMALAPRAGGGMAGAPGPIVMQDRSMDSLGQGLAGLGQGLASIGQMREKVAQREAFEAAIATLPPEEQAMARLYPDAYVQAKARAMFAKPDSMKPVALGQGQVLVDPVTGREIAAGPKKADPLDIKGSAETGFYVIGKDANGRPTATMLIEPKTDAMTSLQKDYAFAKKDGFKGSFTDFVRDTRSTAIERAPQGYERTPEGLRPIPGGPVDPNAPAPQPQATTTPTGSKVGALGVPLPDTDPTEGLPPKDRADLAAKIRLEAIKEFAKSQESVDQARNVNDSLARFVQLIDEGMNTGGQYKIPGAKMIGTTMSDSLAEAQSIVDMMTPMMRQGMPGAASDRDVAMFRGATVGLDKPEQANRNIAAGLMASRQNLIERDQFMQTYFDQNRHLQGADRAWKKYLDANPIFDPKAPKGSYNLNPNRADWRQWFAGEGEVAPAPASTVAQPSIPSPPSGFVVSD